MNRAQVDHLAEATANAFYETAGAAERWHHLPEHKRATFRDMVRAGVAAGQPYRGVKGVSAAPAVARAMSDAFLGGRDCPGWLRHRYDWNTGLSRLEARTFWIEVASHLIAAAREMAGRGRVAA